ncbi:MAG: hypothetical protein U0704_13665 [Candidatus Eisenbacteria bacterium]
MPTLCALLGLAVWLDGCGKALPIQPVNHSPEVMGLSATAGTLAVGDSALVICRAFDPDGDTLQFDWASDCHLVKRGAPDQDVVYNFGDTLMVYGGTCVTEPANVGHVDCVVRDGRGGARYAGSVYITIVH